MSCLTITCTSAFCPGTHIGDAVTNAGFRVTALGVAEVRPGCTAKGHGGLLARDLWPRLACQAALVGAEVLPGCTAEIIGGIFAMNIKIGHTALGVAEVLPGCTAKVVGGLLARDPWLRLGGC